jgi:hypothetical protein
MITSDLIKFSVKKLRLILSVGLCEGGALHLAQRLAPSAKSILILAKFYEVLIFCFFCIKTKESVRVNLSGVYTLQLKTEYGVLMKK